MSDESTAKVINDALVEPVPEMRGVPTLDVSLILGIKESGKGDGSWANKAVIRELTGADEEFLASVEQKEDITYGDYLSNVVARGTVSIGDVSVDGDTKIVDQLALFDRDLLLLSLVRATYGDEREVVVSCPKCDHSNDVIIELSKDFPVTEPDFDVSAGLPVQTSRGEVLLGFPKVGGILPTNDMNVAEVNTDMLAKCVIFEEDKSFEERKKWARNLSIKDRRKLTEALLAAKVGPQLREVNTQCASCGKDMPILLDWVSLLLG